MYKCMYNVYCFWIIKFDKKIEKNFSKLNLWPQRSLIVHTRYFFLFSKQILNLLYFISLWLNRECYLIIYDHSMDLTKKNGKISHFNSFELHYYGRLKILVFYTDKHEMLLSYFHFQQYESCFRFTALKFRQLVRVHYFHFHEISLLCTQRI